MLHPAAQLAVWMMLALGMQLLPLSGLVLLSVVVVPAVVIWAPHRAALLLRRSRWLFLSIVLLFAYATPGQPLVAGITIEGLVLALEHGLRLALMLVTLAIVHERLGNGGLLAGLYVLMAPLSHYCQLRQRIVARLLLVLEYVEQGVGPGGWRTWLTETGGGPDRIELVVAPLAARDWLVLAIAAVAGILMLGRLA